MSVKGRFDGWTAARWLSEAHQHVSLDVWTARARAGDLLLEGVPIRSLDHVVHGGNRVVHVERDHVEPAVPWAIDLLHDDPALCVVDKPAPMPMHPSGRYHLHSLSCLLERAFPGETYLPVHRLDADTTGVAVFARHRRAARVLARQFEVRSVHKRYLARVVGRVEHEQFECALPVSSGPEGEGRRSARSGRAALTRVRCVARETHSSVVLAEPVSGRTNQIRLHLAMSGHPIVGDEAYGRGASMKSGEELLHLHAWTLTLEHPESARRLTLESPMPDWVGAAASRQLHQIREA